MASNQLQVLSRCRWCRNTYKSAGTYSNHVRKMHPSQYDEICNMAPPSPDEGSTCDDEVGDMDIVMGDMDLVMGDMDIIMGDTASDINSDQEYISDDYEETTADDEQSIADETFPAHLQAGLSVEYRPFSKVRDPDWNPVYPFHNPVEYRLARYFHRSQTPKHMVAEYFQEGLARPEVVSFSSGHTLHGVIDSMIDTPPWTKGEVDFRLQEGVEWYSRDIILCAQYLCAQRVFNGYMSWSPIRAKDYEGSRVYSELNTGEWWWDTQV
jgi:hypothetical protein